MGEDINYLGIIQLGLLLFYRLISASQSDITLRWAAAIDLVLQFGVRDQDIAQQTEQLLVDTLAAVGNLRHSNGIETLKHIVSELFSTARGRHV